MDNYSASLPSAQGAGSTAKIPAAKIHVLGLAPLKQRLGAKWDRLSDLVHKLFETSIARAQSPGDHHFRIDELSYALTFHNLSAEESTFACTAIAKEVCQLLFGEQIEDISVRSIVGEIAVSRLRNVSDPGALIGAILESCGTETIVTQSTHSASQEPVVGPSRPVQPQPESPQHRIDAAQKLLAPAGIRMGFMPVWDLKRKNCVMMSLVPFWGTVSVFESCGRRVLNSFTDNQIVDVEIALLRAASAYAERVHDANKVCAVGVGASWDTLSALHSRIRYITAIQTVRPHASCPLLIKIEQIPPGTTLIRIGELLAMLNFANIRLLVEFQAVESVPDIDVRLNAAGVGGIMPAGIGIGSARIIADNLKRRTATQKLFTFLDGLNTPDLVEIADQSQTRFATGSAFGVGCFRGLEDIPDFPIMLRRKSPAAV